jgi:hypothetical protein
MKVSNTVVSVVVVAAVLIFAYGVGLLIRQARTGSPQSKPAQVKDTASPQRPGPGAARTNDTPEERLRLKEEKAKAIEKASAQTDEEKQKLRDQVIKQVGGRRGGRGRRGLPPQERQTETISTPNQPQSGRSHEDANTPASQSKGVNAPPSTEKGSSEPGKAGPG